MKENINFAITTLTKKGEVAGVESASASTKSSQSSSILAEALSLVAAIAEESNSVNTAKMAIVININGLSE